MHDVGYYQIDNPGNLEEAGNRRVYVLDGDTFGDPNTHYIIFYPTFSVTGEWLLCKSDATGTFFEVNDISNNSGTNGKYPNEGSWGSATITKLEA